MEETLITLPVFKQTPAPLPAPSTTSYDPSTPVLPQTLTQAPTPQQAHLTTLYLPRGKHNIHRLHTPFFSLSTPTDIVYLDSCLF